MTDKRIPILALLLASLVLALIVLFVLLPRADASGATIDINGQAVDIGAAAVFKVQSIQSVMEYPEVIVTTSIVTVTVWMKP